MTAVNSQINNTNSGRETRPASGPSTEANLYAKPLRIDPELLSRAPDNRTSFTDLEGPYHPKEISASKVWLQKGIDLVNRALGSSKNLCSGFLSQISSFGKSILRNPTMLAWTSGIGAAIVAVLSVKNIFHGINIAVGRREGDKLPSLMYLFQGLLQGGLTAALLSNIVGWRNPFAQTIGDRLVVAKRMMVGGIVAPVLMGLWIMLAQGNTPLNRLPVIGPIITNVAETIPAWFKDAFKSDSKTIPSAMTPNAAQAAQQG